MFSLSFVLCTYMSIAMIIWLVNWKSTFSALPLHKCSLPANRKTGPPFHFPFSLKEQVWQSCRISASVGLMPQYSCPCKPGPPWYRKMLYNFIHVFKLSKLTVHQFEREGGSLAGMMRIINNPMQWWCPMPMKAPFSAYLAEEVGPDVALLSKDVVLHVGLAHT